MRLFNYDFDEDVSGVLLQDLVTLEKEGRIYTYFYSESEQESIYYRIKLLPDELVEYVEAAKEYDRFTRALLKSNDFEAALEAIHDPVMGKRVRNYPKENPDGGDFGCFASFVSEYMESLLIGDESSRYERVISFGAESGVNVILQIIEAFPVCARHLSARKHSRPSFQVENEYDVQDLLFTMLRPYFNDLNKEDVAPKVAGGSSGPDFSVLSAKCLVEAKFVRAKGDHTRVVKELKEDIESFYSHPSCDNLIAFVYDPGQHTPDPKQIEKDLSGPREIKGVRFQVFVVVRPQ